MRAGAGGHVTGGCGVGRRVPCPSPCMSPSLLPSPLPSRAPSPGWPQDVGATGPVCSLAVDGLIQGPRLVRRDHLCSREEGPSEWVSGGAAAHPPTSLQISLRQGMRADPGALAALCEKTDNDIRACINTLQVGRCVGGCCGV